MTFHLMPTATTSDQAARQTKVAVLPIGSFEQHGPHLPLITDTVVAAVIAQAIAQAYPAVASLTKSFQSCLYLLSGK
jgi:creatinine amidohydrolase